MSDTTIETPAEESGPEAPTRTLSNADLEAFAAIIAAAMKPVESASAAVEPVTEPAPEVEPVVAPVEAASITNEETEVSQTFTLEQVQQIAAEAAKAAVEATKADAVESYRSGDGARKGLVTEAGADYSALEHEEDDPRKLAEMSQNEFRMLAKERWSTTPFFANMFYRADNGL
jgi:hypothetical protein